MTDYVPPDPWTQSFQRLFCEQLVATGVLSSPDADRAFSGAMASGERIDEVCSKLGLISEEHVARALGRHLGLPLVVPDDIPSSPVLEQYATEAFVRGNKVLPLRLTDRVLEIGIVDPFDVDSAKALAYAAGTSVELKLFEPSLFDGAVEALYGFHEGGDGSGQEYSANEADTERLRDLASEAPIIRLVNQLIAKAIEMAASDVHIEPTASEVAVRYRIDGTLRVAAVAPLAQKAAIISRIKIMARLDIGERRLPQDGRIRLAIRGLNVDLRISTVPTMHGENVVVRILDRARVQLSYDALGFSPLAASHLRQIMSEPNGIVLVTGPTGSGKTTTLYTALKSMTDGQRKIFTVEDPVEYELKGISQIQVHPAIGLTFPHSLRAILRQDPDVIMIGEIRDVETARIAIQAALTGHLVLSTLHTNSAVAAIARLTDMGVEPYLTASTVRGVLAQRLVRKLCPACSEPHAQAAAWAGRLAKIVGGESRAPDIRAARGCDRCRQSGYFGRTTICELLRLQPVLQEIVQSGGSATSLLSASRKRGMKTLFEDGAMKVWSGETSPEEMMRAAGDDDQSGDAHSQAERSDA